MIETIARIHGTAYLTFIFYCISYVFKLILKFVYEWQCICTLVTNKMKCVPFKMATQTAKHPGAKVCIWDLRDDFVYGKKQYKAVIFLLVIYKFSVIPINIAASEKRLALSDIRT